MPCFDEYSFVGVLASIMTNFEKAIINACEEVFLNSPLSYSFFHLSQSVYRQIQSVGLQAAYNDPNERSLKVYAHMMLALAFVSLADVLRIFSLLKNNAPKDLLPIFEYFENNFILDCQRD